MGLLSAGLMLMRGQSANLATIIIVMIAEPLISAHIQHKKTKLKMAFIKETRTDPPASSHQTRFTTFSFFFFLQNQTHEKDKKNVTEHSHTRSRFHTRSHCHGDSGATKGQTAPQVIDERAQVSVRHRACRGELLPGPATDTVDIQHGATTQKKEGRVATVTAATCYAAASQTEVTSQSSHAHGTHTNTHWKHNKHDSGNGLESGRGFSCFLPSALEGAEESIGLEGGGEGRREGGRRGSMHLWRTAGKGHFSLHGSTPAVWSLPLRAFMSKHGDFVRSRGGGEVGGGEKGASSHSDGRMERRKKREAERPSKGIALLMLHNAS